ncbi:MAG: YdjY domain-containing protein [Chloroherpetonaceae bacterium]
MLQINNAQKTVLFSGKMFPSQFNAFTSWTKNHHFIVYEHGRAAHNALVKSDVSDLDILNALETLGAKAGNNLSVQSWEKRADKTNPEPDKHVEGSLIEVLTAWEHHLPLQAAEIFHDKFGKGFEFRFGGHRDLMNVWKSGCIVCLQSCPGGRISNATYTMRDYQRGLSQFDLKKSVLPKDGTSVIITLKVCDELC